MKKLLPILLIGLLVFSTFSNFIPYVVKTNTVSAYPLGELQYPIEGYVVNGYYFGQYLPTEDYPERYHLGEDICKPAGTQVVAMAEGVVKVANGNHASYGGLIIIEHTLSDGKTYCSLYGHLKHSETLVELEDTVSKGQPIGELSGEPADYGGPGSVPHLHFGIRFGAFPGEHALDEDTTSRWYWGGYGKKDPQTFSDWWIKPSDFIAGQSTIVLSLVSCYSQKFPFIYLIVRASSDGQPVSYLTKDNFLVTEDGRLQTDRFDVVPPEEGGGVRMADIVFLIDTSGSMGSEITAVRDNCVAFADMLAVSDIDYRLGLVQFGQSADGGHPRIIGGGLTSSASTFQSWVATLYASGGYEPGFAAIRLAIQSYNFRPGSQKVFILITDEDSDCRDKQTTINMILDNDVTVHVAADCNFGTSQSDYCGPGSVRDVSGGLLFPVTGDYRSILDTIGEAVADAYIVRYRTDNPALDGSERTVVCTVQYGAATDSVQCTYIAGGAPHIQRTEETLLLHEQSLVASSSPTISVKVTDAAAPFVQNVYLYVRTSGSGSDYVQINMVPQGNDVYSAVVPGSYVSTPGVDYYIKATDGQATSWDPSTEPDVYPYQIAVLPNEAPVIAHAPPTAWQAGDDICLTISASDSTYGIARLDVYFRRQGDLIWQCISKNYDPTATSINLVVELPVATWSTQVIEYYIRVTDDLGVSTCWPMGGADNPHLVGTTTSTNWFKVIGTVVAYICNDTVGFRFERNLASGSTGDDVKFLQILLNTNPLTRLADQGAGSPGNETTTYGPITQAAVKRFQQQCGLPQDGMVAGDTRTGLNQLVQRFAAVKTIPNGWILRVVNTHGNSEVHYGCTWWEVEDVTDGIRGWIPYRNNNDGTTYLENIAASIGNERTRTIAGVDERKTIIVDAVGNRATLFAELASFPSELMLAIISGEMPATADNTYVSFDCGRGISQVTTNSLVGQYSQVRCYGGSTRGYMPYEFVYPFDRSITTAYWTDRGCNSGSYRGETAYWDCGCKEEPECDGSQSWYYGGTDTSGRCRYYPLYDDGCRAYTNTVQGIEANLKDGKGALKDFYKTSISRNENTESGFAFTTQLKIEARGKEVAYLQYILKSETDQNLPVTAYFGSMTEQALKSFQAQEFPDREPSGIVDQETRNRLNTLLDTNYDYLRNKMEETKSWVGATWRYNHGDPDGIIRTDIRDYLASIAAHLRVLGSRFPDYRTRLGNDVLNEADRQLLLAVMENYLYFKIRSPVELRIYDSEGNMTGTVSGQPYEDIPDSLYDADNEIAMILLPYCAHIYEVVGISTGSYGAQAGLVQDGKIVLFSAEDIPINSNAIHRYTMDWDALARGEKGVTVHVDSDGDGEFDRTFRTGSDLTGNEFVLKTETTIDFKPDTFNRKSQGKWVTTYIELPEGFNVSNVTISSIKLNGVVPAEAWPTEIGDYNDNGIPELMVKFSRSAVAQILQPGTNVEIKVSGTLNDGMEFEGVDYITVLN